MDTQQIYNGFHCLNGRIERIKIMKQSWILSHAETITQNIVGLLIGFIILKTWGMSSSESVGLQAIIFVTSYARSYIIRRIFNKF